MKRKSIISLLIVLCLCVIGFFGCANNGEVSNNKVLTIYSTRIQLSVGSTHKIVYDYDGDLEFVSTNTTIATVSNTGVVTALSEGQTFIQLKTESEEKTIAVYVEDSTMSVKLDKEDVSVVKNSEQYISATVYKGQEIINENVKWTTSSSEVEIESKGNFAIIKSNSVGYYTITATYDNSIATCTIKVVENSAKQLSKPSVAIVDCDCLNITSVNGADKYLVRINDGEWVEITQLTYSLEDVSNTLKKDEIAEVYIKAIAQNDFNFIDSDVSYAILSHKYVDNSENKNYDCENKGTANFVCENCDRGYTVDKYADGHSFVDGVCEKCSVLQSPGISYEYNAQSNSYWVKATNPSATPETTYVAGSYDDGVNGRLPVTDIGRSAFANNMSIIKVYLPESVTTIRREAFSECTNLQFISMPGVSCISDMQDVGGLEYNHFLGCVSLTTVIVPGGFRVDTQVFNSYYQAGYVPQLDFYATSKVTINAKSSKANDMLSEKVYYYDATGTDCNGWRYGKHGEIVVNYTHNYVTKNGQIVCGKCGYQYDEFFKYAYKESTNSYMIAGLINTNTEEINGIPESYNDGMHGVLPVDTIGAGAFKENSYIKRVYLPKTITALTGSTFESSSNLEYVEMLGITTNIYANNGDNHFMNCTKLKTVILGESFSSEVKMFFVHPGPAEQAVTNIYLSSFDGTFSCAGENDLLTGKIYNYEQTGKICGTWRYNENKTDVITNVNEHAYEDGVCKNCGVYLSNGVIYSFMEEESAYCVTGYTSDSTEVNIYERYNDGIHGEHVVNAIGSHAFAKKVITKLIAPSSVVSIGSEAFSECYYLEYVALPGLTNITYAKDGLNHFLFCGNLKTVILGESFESDVQVFVAADDQTAKKLDIYLSSADGTFASGGNAGLLSGNVYYYDANGSCGTWKYNIDKTDVVLAPKHEYSNAVCKNCGTAQTLGITYEYSQTDGGYVVTSYTGISREVYILSEFNEKPVVAIGVGAFAKNTNIVKVVAPESVVKVGGNAFSECYSLKYVALPGWTENSYWDSINGLQEHNNQFCFCDSIEVLILGDTFTTNVGIIPSNGSQTAKCNIYLTSAEGTVSGSVGDLWTQTIYYYSESEPTDTTNMYWHYDENYVATLWK